MLWEKKGRVYVPDGSRWWAKKYAFPPTPYLRLDGVLRLYMAFCDENAVGRLGYVDVDPHDPGRVLAVSEEPLLDIGRPGAFDENGVLPTCVVPVGDELYLYYVGYQLGYKVRYFQFEGLGISRDGGESFQRYANTPILDRSDKEFLNRTSAFVMHEGDRFRMWYVGGSEWTHVDGKHLPVYNLKHATSPDGKHWPSEGETVLDFAHDDEHAFGRPWVLYESGTYRMWYSVRTRSRNYRLGYAESPDGLRWTRKDDEVGIDVSESGWDSEMIAYSSLVRHGERTYLFYNGNNCGMSGFGYAVLHPE